MNQSPTARLRADAFDRLDAWTPPDDTQAALRASYLDHLAHHPDACDRSCAPGHLTASAMVFSHDLNEVALVLHGIVGAWLQPGGHLEADDMTLVDAAQREVREELGLELALDPVPVSLDCHPSPAAATPSRPGTTTSGSSGVPSPGRLWRARTNRMRSAGGGWTPCRRSSTKCSSYCTTDADASPERTPRAGV